VIPKAKDLIIFDFDGVLADSFDYFYALNRDGMKHVGLSFTKEDYRNLFIDNVHRGFKDFINNNQKYLAYSEFRKANYDRRYYDKERGVKLFPKVPIFLKKISKAYLLAVASSGQQKNIRNLLNKAGVESLFDLILADSNYSKKETIKKILNKHRVNSEQTFFVTDTVGDVKAAKKCGLKTIAITWGFHDKKTLMTAGPDYIVADFKALGSILKSSRPN